ncbi:Telomere replication protein EST3 [Wickerhamomyces ciferrii]|uniref:Telomere replication protein EST3 n=1 Tax=Wickerhamomyces ciferrii (strain ATCC 14091 / BCRC 22168 / CBS 111 / JCM 3599 / NBRC 0793 / NRRL Y-1031 F-60-10) TaxID=1206466 RepID=K0KXU3_WICCF|nr:Telomere replication protein EST3 [Wickerhamomyces ciferrii]CCH46259.1 Telomere replication protein EST3 [Wickerhamomyces ciferrii]
MDQAWTHLSLAFLKFNEQDNSFLVSISDSNNSILAIITRDCINTFETNQSCRITKHTTDTLVLIRKTKLKWMNKFQYKNLIKGLDLRYGDLKNYSIVEINELEIFDADQTQVLVKLEPVYLTEEYKNAVRPYKAQKDELQCL